MATIPPAAARAVVGGLPGSLALAFEPESTERIAPATPGGGWDFTCLIVHVHPPRAERVVE